MIWGRRDVELAIRQPLRWRKVSLSKKKTASHFITHRHTRSPLWLWRWPAPELSNERDPPMFDRPALGHRAWQPDPKTAPLASPTLPASERVARVALRANQQACKDHRVGPVRLRLQARESDHPAAWHFFPLAGHRSDTFRLSRYHLGRPHWETAFRLPAAPPAHSLTHYSGEKAPTTTPCSPLQKNHGPHFLLSSISALALSTAHSSYSTLPPVARGRRARTQVKTKNKQPLPHTKLWGEREKKKRGRWRPQPDAAAPAVAIPPAAPLLSKERYRSAPLPASFEPRCLFPHPCRTAPSGIPFQSCWVASRVGGREKRGKRKEERGRRKQKRMSAAAQTRRTGELCASRAPPSLSARTLRAMCAAREFV